MTNMERAEELMFNVTRAQEELFAHLRVLSGMMDGIEKNNPLEKNLTPEKNSSEVEKIRQKWMDDVVGLASEFFINEESFNVENLSALLQYTVNALTDMLDPETLVNQTKKKFTFLDKLKEDRPDLINDNDEYLMARYCISEFGYGKACPYEEGPISERCTKCWNREYKYTDTDSVDQTEKKITFREKLAEKHPELINEDYLGGCRDCPGDFWRVPYKLNTSSCTWDGHDNYAQRYRKCRVCWDQAYKEDPPRTCRERLQREYPDKVDTMFAGGCLGCPTDYGYIPEEKILCSGNNPHHVCSGLRCSLCWDQDFV